MLSPIAEASAVVGRPTIAPTIVEGLDVVPDQFNSGKAMLIFCGVRREEGMQTWRIVLEIERSEQVKKIRREKEKKKEKKKKKERGKRQKSNGQKSRRTNRARYILIG